MRLYYNILRSGTDVQTFRKPAIEVRPPAAEGYIAKADFQGAVGLLMELVPFLTEQEATEIVAYYVEYAYWTLHLSAIGVRVWLHDQIVTVAVWLKIGWYGGPIIVMGFVILAILLLGKVTEFPDQHEWGHKWTMRFEGRIWDAEFVKFGPRGEPIFRPLGEYGDVLIAERRKHNFLGEKGDVWDHEYQWIEQKKIGLFWHNYSWSKSVMGWVGVCDRVGSRLYQLQESFWGNLPML